MPVTSRHSRFMSHFRATMLSGFIVLGAGQAVLAQADAQAQAYRVSPNDILQVTVYGQPSLTGLYPVDVDGNIGYPVVGNINVSGLTTPQISEKIA